MLEQLELPDLLTTRLSASRLRRLWVRLGSLCFLVYGRGWSLLFPSLALTDRLTLAALALLMPPVPTGGEAVRLIQADSDALLVDREEEPALRSLLQAAPSFWAAESNSAT